MHLGCKFEFERDDDMASTEALNNSFRLLATKTNKSRTWNLWVRRYKTRRQLKAVSRNDPERLLRDLGLRATAVRAEYEKWFWQA